MTMTPETGLPTAREDLAGLTAAWHHWPVWHEHAIVRRQHAQWVAVAPTKGNWGLYVGPLTVPGGFTDLWLYHEAQAAIWAATRWTGGEPYGWSYHPRTRRRRKLEEVQIG